MRHSRLFAISVMAGVTACGGGGGGGGGGGSTTYRVSGYAAGVVGSGLAVSYNGGAPMSIGNGAFTVATGVDSGTAYTLAITTQPSNPAQTCTLSNGTGTVGKANVASVLVFCPQSVARFVYVVSDGAPTGTLSTYAINASTGELTLVSGSVVGAGPSAQPLVLIPHSSLAMDLSIGILDQFVPSEYLNSAVLAYSVDASTGVLTVLNGGNPYSQLNGTSTTPGCANSGFGNTEALTFTPNGAFGYLLNGPLMASMNEGIWQFTWNATTGAPALVGSQVLGCDDPNPITIDPSGVFAYISAAAPTPLTTTSAIYTFSIDSGTGALTQLSSYALPSGYEIGQLALDPFGRFAYGEGLGGSPSSVNLLWGLSIDPASHAVTQVPGMPFAAEDLQDFVGVTVNPAGTFAFLTTLSGISTYAVDPNTGALTPASGTAVVPLEHATQPLQIDPSGQFAYVVAAEGADLTAAAVFGFSLDSSTGVLTPLAGSPFIASANPTAITLAN